jgi:site-specific recombinase XerD
VEETGQEIELKTLREQLQNAAFDAGGSFKTRDGRQIVLARFHEFLKSHNIQIRSLEQIKAKYVLAYVEFRKNAGIGKRTLQNEVTALRCTLRAAGRHKLADQFDNKALGISGASRDGSKTAMADSRFSTLRAAVFAIDQGVGTCVDLERALGLRAEEAVKSCKSLTSWAKQLASGKPVHVIFGTKGGRPRLVNPANRQRAMEAVQAAEKLAAIQNGVLVNKPDEKSAMNRYKNVMTQAGFMGKESGHALRYAFARDQIAGYLACGYSRTEALALTSVDLGHGDGRGRYIAQVYTR